MNTFDTMFSRLIANEQGYVNNPADPGGETKYGISKRSYPAEDIKNMTLDRAAVLYRRDFWNAINADSIPPATVFQVFDAAVNHGIGNATRMLQDAVGTAPDGHIGPLTMAAIAGTKPDVLTMKFIAARMRFCTKLSTWASFGKGLMNRIATNLDVAAEDA